MPFAGTSVFGRDWEGHHRPVEEDTQTATGRVYRRSSEGVFNEVTGRTEYPEPALVYGTAETPGRMRVVRDGVESTLMIGERQVVQRHYIVQLPATAPEIRVNDEVRVATAGDPLLPGVPLWVVDPRLGSQIWGRDLLCSNVPPTQR